MVRQKIYLIRHGQVNGNIFHLREKVTVGDFNTFVTGEILREPLNPVGLEQIAATADRLRNCGLTRIYTSPLPRAQQSAQIIGTTLNLPVSVHDDLYEIPRIPIAYCSPAWRFPLWVALALSGVQHAMLWRKDIETLVGSYRRARRALRALLAETPTDFGIVGHQGFFRILLADAHLYPRWRVQAEDTSNAGISIICRV